MCATKVTRLSVENGIRLTSWWLNWCAGAALVLMVVLNVVNILGRLIFRSPIKGTYEIVSFLGVAVAVFAMGYTAIERGHVSIEILVTRLPERVQLLIDCLVNMFSIGVFSLLAWQSAVYATDLWREGELSMGLRIPYYPVVYGVAVGCTILALVLVVLFSQSLKQILNR